MGRTLSFCRTLVKAIQRIQRPGQLEFPCELLAFASCIVGCERHGWLHLNPRRRQLYVQVLHGVEN